MPYVVDAYLLKKRAASATRYTNKKKRGKSLTGLPSSTCFSYVLLYAYSWLDDILDLHTHDVIITITVKRQQLSLAQVN